MLQVADDHTLALDKSCAQINIFLICPWQHCELLLNKQPIEVLLMSTIDKYFCGKKKKKKIRNINIFVSKIYLASYQEIWCTDKN